jgi:ketosteroid isomerase-like protein
VSGSILSTVGLIDRRHNASERGRAEVAGPFAETCVLAALEARMRPMSTETEALKQFFSAINRNDMQAIAKHFDAQIVRIEPEGFPTAGTYRGIAEVQEHVTKGRGTWAEGTCEPEEFLVNGDKVVVYLHAWVRLEDSTEWVGGRFADGFVFRNGKITQYLSFGERAEALKWAGISD